MKGAGWWSRRDDQVIDDMGKETPFAEASSSGLKLSNGRVWVRGVGSVGERLFLGGCGCAEGDQGGEKSQEQENF